MVLGFSSPYVRLDSMVSMVSDKNSDNYTIFVAALTIYSSITVAMIFFLICSAICRRDKIIGTLAVRVRAGFRFCLFSFLFLRIVWLGLHAFAPNVDDENGDCVSDCGYEAATFVLNRFCFTSLFSAYSLVVFFWAERFHKNYFDTKGFLPELGWVFLLTNILAWVFVIIIVALWFYDGEEREGNPLYDANIYTDVILSVAVSFGFLFYGCLLFRRISLAEAEVFEDRKNELVKILVVTIIFSTCFLVRSVIFLYRPITNDKIPNVYFYIFAYFFPELVPSLLQFYISESTVDKQERDANFIDGLYENSQDSIDEWNNQMSDNERERNEANLSEKENDVVIYLDPNHQTSEQQQQQQQKKYGSNSTKQTSRNSPSKKTSNSSKRASSRRAQTLQNNSTQMNTQKVLSPTPKTPLLSNSNNNNNNNKKSGNDSEDSE